MSFQDLLNKYNGQQDVGNTPENKGECTGLVNVWIENLGLPHLWGHARDIFANADQRYYEKYLNTPDFIFKQGDIVCKTGGTYGHVAIATGGAGTDLHKYEVFEQNVPIGGSCRLHTYTDEYKDVIGGLRPKSTQLDSQTIILQQSDAFIAICTKLNLPANRDIVLADLDKLITMQDAVMQKEKQLADAQLKTQELEKTIAEKETALVKLQIDLKNLADEVAIAVAENKNMSIEITKLKETCKPAPTSGFRKWLYDLLIR